MKKKFQKNQPEEEEEPLGDGETYLTENDTKEIESYIKELGIDKFDPGDFVVPEKEEKKKKGKNEKASANLTPLGQKGIDDQASKFQPKKSKKQNDTKQLNSKSDSSKQPAINVDAKPQNKKIVFDSKETDHKSKETTKENGTTKLSNKSSSKKAQQGPENPTTSQQTQNKKIVFDADYLEESRKKNAPKNDTKKDSNSDGEWYKLLIRPDAPWYHQGKKLKSDDSLASPEDVRKCEIEGQRYLEEDSTNYLKVRSYGADKSETKWLQTVLKSGTFADKIAAHTLLLQESPAHNLASLKFLISLLDVKGRRECLSSLDSLLGAFTSGKLLNPNAKLVPINKQPISALAKVTPRERKELLALWSFQNQLKDYYSQFLLQLDGLLKDAVEATRRKGISAVATMLAYCPEQEQSLLTRLINKIGDPTRVVATSAVGQLEKLLQKHSNMKAVVVAEVERLLYRPNINVKAQYYALCFLSQVLLDEDDVSLAMKLIVIYVSFFKACVKKGEVDSKLMAALLTGLRRAFPYAKFAPGTSGPLNTHIDTLFKLVHMVKFALAVQVLYILDQVAGIDPSNADRFYSVLFRKLYDFDIIHTTKHSMFLNLLFRALKRDESVARLRCFIKRILQVCLSSPPQLACGLLYLVSELIKGRPEIRTLNPESVTSTVVIDDDDDEEEHYKDVDDGQEDSSKNIKENGENSKQASWVHRNNTNTKTKARTGYDPLARNPLYGRAEQSGGYWEMNLLAAHFHPSVALFANTVMEGKAVEYTGDPLQDFTLIRFLDRFVFRNPKKVQSSGPAQKRVLGKRNNYAPTGARSMAVDSKEFINQPKRVIPADEMFLYDYFKQRATTVGTKLEKEKKKDDDSDDGSDVESVASEEFDEYLMKGAVLDFSADMKAKPKSDKKKKKAEQEGSDEDIDGAASDVDDAEADSDEDFSEDEEFQNAFKDFDDMLNEPADASGEEGVEGSTDEDDEDLEEADLGTSDEEENADGVREEDIEFSDDEDEDLPAPKSKGKKRPKHNDDIDDLDFALDAENVGKKKKKMRDMFDTNGTDFVAAEDFAAMLESHSSGPKTAGTSEDMSNKDKASVKQLQWEMARNKWIKGDNRPRKGGKPSFKSGRKGFKGGDGYKKGVKRGGKR